MNSVNDVFLLEILENLFEVIGLVIGANFSFIALFIRRQVGLRPFPWERALISIAALTR